VVSTTPECKIADYAIIGDCRSAALVSRYGSIDWLCWPRFDSAAVFAALLDPERGGHWSIAPADDFTAERQYLEGTNILATRFRAGGGAATLLDLMPVASEQFKNENLVPDHEIVRRLECTAGEMRFRLDLRPRAEYGLKPLRFRDEGKLGLRIDARPGVYRLASSHPVEIEGDRARALVTLKRGERAYFSFSYAEESPLVLAVPGTPLDAAIERSRAWWEDWTQTCEYQGPYREAVVRSALALKLLTYAPSGAITAAATTSLPELPGADLNWDYRYCWLRDASLTMRALLGLGYRDEAESFLGWLLHATRLTHPELKVLYTVFGRALPREHELTHLSGYAGSRPVRVGNAADNQLQLDIYGVVVEAAGHFADHGGRFDNVTQGVLRGLGKYVAGHWDQADEGVWEPRTGRRNHTYSRLLCWTALGRVLALHRRGLLRGIPAERFEQERERIREQILQRAWNERRQSYVSTLDGDALDACLLRLPWYGFEPADSPRMTATYRAISSELGAGNGLLYRYRREPAEGAFGICGFWGVEYLALGGGSLAEAHQAFRRLLGYANDVGLFAEETAPATGEALGNFPQSFTHVGLISAALTLAEREAPSRTSGPRPAAGERETQPAAGEPTR
jgi:GH15 family glucan-1,4-alpha-glucosidase